MGYIKIIISIVSLLFFISPDVAIAQTTYMQGKVVLTMNGNSTKFIAKKFHQQSTNANLSLYGASSIYISGDSVTSQGTWLQTSNTSVFFSPPFNITEGLHTLRFLASSSSIFRNISFLNIQSNTGVLLQERVNHILQIAGSFNLPDAPVFLGSKERNKIADYFNDINNYLILKSESILSFNNLTTTNFIVTSSKSALEQTIKTGETAVYPVGYNSIHFSPVEIGMPSEQASFKVTASAWLYSWDKSFISTPSDTVDETNIRKTGADIMWIINSSNENSSVNIYTQLQANSNLFQGGYDKSSSMLIRYVGTVDNSIGSKNSRTYWENSNISMNVPYSIFPSVLPADQSHTLLRQAVNQLNTYNIFTPNIWLDEEFYPLSVKLSAVDWDTTEIVLNVGTSLYNLNWKLLSAPRRVSTFVVRSSETNTFPVNPTVASVSATSFSRKYSTPLNSSILGNAKNFHALSYEIEPKPITEALDTFLYYYPKYIKVADTINTPIIMGKSKIQVRNNPYSLETGFPIEFSVILPEATTSSDINKLSINFISATSLESIILKQVINNPSPADLQFEINPLRYGLYQGHYIIVMEIEYATGIKEKIFNKFTIY